MKRKGYNILIGIFFIVLLIGIAQAGMNFYTGYLIDKDTTAWLNRAQVASNPEDMKEYLTKCWEGMHRWELTDGYSVIIFETPENDMLLIMRALERSIDRCDDISEMDNKSPEYQTALDDVRGQIRELDIQSTGRYWTKNFVTFCMPFILIMLGVVGMFLSLIKRPYY